MVLIIGVKLVLKNIKKQYYKKNKDKIINNVKKWIKDNIEKRKEICKKYRKKNEEKLKMIRKEVYKKNKDNILRKRLEYYKKNKDKINKYYMKNNEHIKNKAIFYYQNKKLTPEFCYNLYKKYAIKRNIAYEITFEQFLLFWNKNCFYCDDKIETIGLDRLDNKKGYFLENIVPCCTFCNKAKNNRTLEFFLEKCKKICKKLGENK